MVSFLFDVLGTFITQFLSKHFSGRFRVTDGFSGSRNRGVMQHASSCVRGDRIDSGNGELSCLDMELVADAT